MVVEDEESTSIEEPKPPRTLLPLPWAIWVWKQARKIVVIVIGATLLIIGIIGMGIPVLPGWPFVWGGIAVLATEFAWARWVLKVAKQRVALLAEAAKKNVRRTEK